MARYRRLGPKDVTQHVIQRGNNRKICFSCNQDFMAYIFWLKKYSTEFDVSIHAWVLMTNHVHLLCTPNENNRGVSKMMQSLGRQYVRYFNHKYSRTGTLWEGRFKSCLVCTLDYLLELYRYIELNPVRANMTSDPAYYYWSSYQINALGKSSELCRPHPTYLGLGETKFERLKTYRMLFQEVLSQSLIDSISKCVNKEIVLGNDKFKAEIESLTKHKLKTGKLGRPSRCY